MSKVVHNVIVDEMIKLGHEAVGISSAIDQFSVAWSNASPEGDARWDRFESPVFLALSARREYIRQRLMNIHHLHYEKPVEDEAETNEENA